VARKILLDQLTGQARSRGELATRLRKKDVPDAIANRLLDRFGFKATLHGQVLRNFPPARVYKIIRRRPPRLSVAPR